MPGQYTNMFMLIFENIDVLFFGGDIEEADTLYFINFNIHLLLQ